MGKPPTYHGGPEVKLAASESSAHRRGLKQTNPVPDTHLRVIVRDGLPVMAKRLKKIISEVLASRAKLDAELELSPKFRTQAQRSDRERLGSGGTLTNVNRMRLQDPAAGEQDRVDERALSMAAGRGE